MVRTILTAFATVSLLIAQDYHWPIRASRSLSATFCEYRSGHLHAGIDIKTWGEIEVPCLAIADGYIERILVGYNGYGRGLVLRLNDGNSAIYGHLELFTPKLEEIVQAEQLQRDQYSFRIQFTPEQFPVKAGQFIGYSGTSGTEHPHLHFEIRDSLRQVLNPHFFYSGVKDTRAPVIDEILLFPASSESRINNSRFPVIIDLQTTNRPVSTTGPFRLAINTHDRANGTLNKCSVYRADAFVNDSLAFSRKFDRVPMKLMDSVKAIYPGVRGKRGWRFMTMFNDGESDQTPFTPSMLHGTIIPEGVSTLKLRVADIQRNVTTKEFLFRDQTLASWELEQVGESFHITRKYTENRYEKFQFYTGNNVFVPVAQTFYRLKSTTWILNPVDKDQGIRALGALGGEIKWIVSPQNQAIPGLTHQWIPKDDGFVLKLESDEQYIYPISYDLYGNSFHQSGELVQTNPYIVETDIIPLGQRAQARFMKFREGLSILYSLKLKPLHLLNPSDSTKIISEQSGLSLKAMNKGDHNLYLGVDTTTALFDGQIVVGITIKLLGSDKYQFRGQLSFQHPESEQPFSIFTPGKKGVWKRLSSRDSTNFTLLDIQKGGRFFLVLDNQAPSVRPLTQVREIKTGTRLVFKIIDNSGFIRYRRPSLAASLDGEKFFPDYNPLRQELSFHVPHNFQTGQHTFKFSVQDASENTEDYVYQFTVRR